MKKMNEKIYPIGDYNCFIDEVELPATTNTNLTLVYFGILIPTSNNLENDVNSLIAHLNGKKFHSKKAYKKSENKTICDGITDIIIKNDLRVFIYPFQKVWIDSPRLAILKTLKLNELSKVNTENYRSIAWYTFIHAFNGFLLNHYKSTKTRLLFDPEWLKSNEMVEHNGTILTAISNMLSIKPKVSPLIYLPDHVGYLYQKLKKITCIKDKKTHLKKYDNQDYVTLNTIKLFGHLTKNKLLTTLDLWEWIDAENNR